MRSNSGASRMNSQYSSSVVKPITRSTPARLYQERSNMTISPAAGRCGTYRWKYHWDRSRSVGLTSATTVAPRGLRCSVKRLIVPPLPAASRPSNTSHDPLPGGLHPVLQLDELDLQRPLEVLVLVPGSSSPGTGSPRARCRPSGRPAHRSTGSSCSSSSSTVRPASSSRVGRPVHRERVEGIVECHWSQDKHSTSRRARVTSGIARNRTRSCPSGLTGRRTRRSRPPPS